MSAATRKGGPVARGAAMLCQNPAFRTWLGLMQKKLRPEQVTEPECADWLRRACRVSSRAELDHNDYARKMFNKIRNQFLVDMRVENYQEQHGFQSLQNPAYLDWVKNLPSVVSGQDGCVAHQLGVHGSPLSDLHVFPLTETEQRALIEDAAKWEAEHGSQWMHVTKTIERAVFEGVLIVSA